MKAFSVVSQCSSCPARIPHPWMFYLDGAVKPRSLFGLQSLPGIKAIIRFFPHIFLRRWVRPMDERRRAYSFTVPGLVAFIGCLLTLSRNYLGDGTGSESIMVLPEGMM